MKHATTILLMSGLLAACATTTQADPRLGLLRSQLEALQDDPQAGGLAPVAMVEADRALDAAAAAVDDPTEFEHRLYLARSRIEIAGAQARRRLAENRARALTQVQGPVRVEPRPTPPEAPLAAIEEDPSAKQLAAMGAQKDELGWKLTLGEALFEPGQAVLGAAATAPLAQLAALLTQSPQYRLLVEGHSDSRGKATDNLRLSQERADAVKQWLVQAGIAAPRIVTVAKGAEFPAADNASAEGRRKNRRVDILIRQ